MFCIKHGNLPPCLECFEDREAKSAAKDARIAELEAEVAYHKRVATEALERLEGLEEVAGDGDGSWYWRATGDYVGVEDTQGERNG